MDVCQKGLIVLVKSAITNKSCRLSEDFSLEVLIDVAQNHQISPIIYYGAINCGFDKASDAMKKLFENSFPLVMLDEMQKTAFEEVMRIFESAGIEYMPLKGSLLKALYPKSEMRTMGDIDILIKTEQYEKISGIMKKLGYEQKCESNHEFIWTKGSLCIELHKMLVPSYHKDYYAYFCDGWKFAEKTENTKYFLKPEAEYIYLFTHFAKHYRSGGIGIKHLTDLWVYKNAKPYLDWEYIKRELAKLRLDNFFENVEKTLDVWFDGKAETPETKLISDTVFGSGAYGDAETDEVSKMLWETKEGKSIKATKFSRFLKVTFLPYENMCEKYDFLKKVPILLPFMWIVRIFDVLLFKRGKMHNYIEKQRRITDEAVSKQKEKLNAVGLDFYTGEDVL